MPTVFRRAGVRRATAAAALAVALALPGTAGAAAPGSEGTGPWVPDGRAVAGTPSGSGAPVLRPDVSYRDTIAKGRTNYYAVHLGSTADTDGADAAPAASYLSAFAVPRPGSHVGFLDGLTLHLQTPQGVQCDTYYARFTGVDASAPVGGVVRRPGASDSVCRSAGTYLLAVERDSAASSSDDVWPLDLRFLAEPALASAPDSGGAVPTYSPADPPLPSGTPRTVRGSSGMDGTGTRLPGSGSYRDLLAPGRTAFYRVPVDWGQRVSVTAQFGDARLTQAAGFAPDGVGVAVFSPARGFVDGQTLSYNGRAVSIAAQGPTVAYANRLSSDSKVNSAAVAGYYYLQVSVHPALAGFTTGGIPVTLRVSVTGAAQAAPAYRTSPAAAGFAVPGGTVTSPASAPAGAGRTAAGGPAPGPAGHRALAFGAFGLAAVLFVWPTLWLLRGRRPAGR